MKKSTIISIFICSIIALTLSPVVSIAAPSGNTNQGISSASQKSRALNERGAKLAQSAKFNEAIPLLREAVSLDSRNLTAVFNLASVYLQKGDVKASISLLEKYTSGKSKDPKFQDPGIYARLGDAYFSNKQIKEAEQNYTKALKLEPLYPKISARLGTIYAMTERSSDAIKMYLKAVEQEPQNADYLSNLSNLYLAEGDSQKAISTAKRGLQVKPSKELYMTLGAAYEKKMEWKNSLIAYQRAKDLGETSKELKKKLEFLKTKS